MMMHRFNNILYLITIYQYGPSSNCRSMRISNCIWNKVVLTLQYYLLA